MSATVYSTEVIRDGDNRAIEVQRVWVSRGGGSRFQSWRVDRGVVYTETYQDHACSEGIRGPRKISKDRVPADVRIILAV